MKSLLPEELQRYFELARSMGRLASQFVNGRPEEIRFTMVGKRFEEDFGERTFDSPFNYQPFTIAALKGFLEVILEDSKNGLFIKAKELSIIAQVAKQPYLTTKMFTQSKTHICGIFVILLLTAVVMLLLQQQDLKRFLVILRLLSIQKIPNIKIKLARTLFCL